MPPNRSNPLRAPKGASRLSPAFQITVAIFWPFLSAAQPSLNLGTSAGYTGATVSLPVTLRGEANMVAAQLDVAFNPARVTEAGLLASGRLSNHVVRTREVAPGVFRVLAYSLVN